MTPMQYFSELFRHKQFDGIDRNNYTVVDVETTGVDVGSDLVVQVGYCAVRDSNIVSHGGILMQSVPGTVFHPKAVKATGLTHDICMEKGASRKETFDEFFGMLMDARVAGHPLVVGHNIVKFDIPFLEFEAPRYRNSWKFAHDSVLDTGMLVKAMQQPYGTGFPLPGETRRAFFMRMGEMRVRTFWRLEYARSLLQLDHYYNLTSFAGNAHDAGYDCLVTHFLLQRIFDLAYGA